MRYLIAGLLLALVPMPVHAEPCDAPGYRLYTTGRVEFRTPGVDTRYVGVRLPFLPGPAFATAVDDAGATNAWISAEVLWPEMHENGYLLLIALKSQLVGEPDYAETLRAVVCVRPAE